MLKLAIHPTEPRKPRNPKGKFPAAVTWLPGPKVDNGMSAYACRPTKLMVWNQAYSCSTKSRQQHRKGRAAAAWHPVTRLTRHCVHKDDSITRAHSTSKSLSLPAAMRLCTLLNDVKEHDAPDMAEVRPSHLSSATRFQFQGCLSRRCLQRRHLKATVLCLGLCLC